jgi:uncharacterized protein (TIGR02145 family)
MKPILLNLLLLSSFFYFTSCQDEKGRVCLLTIDLSVEEIDSDTKLITATGSGGTGNYEWRWHNGVTSNTSSNAQVIRTSLTEGPGRYVFTLEDGTGCVAVDSIDVSFLSTCPFHLDIVVEGGAGDKMLTARARYGNPPYTYQWSEGSTDSVITIFNPVGVVSVTVTDLLLCEMVASKNFSTCPADVFLNGTDLYEVVSIGSQCWTKQNLRTAPAGVPIVTDNAAWSQLTTPAVCYYENNQSMGDTYGLLFNGFAVLQGNLCPQGWHLPTDADWQTLIDFQGGDAFAGRSLKADSDLWLMSDHETNSSGFSALPGGRRQADGSFIYEGSQAHFWTSTETMPDSDRMWYRGMFANTQHTLRIDWDKAYGFSCRCVRD